MINLPVDTTSAFWNAIKAYASLRQTELIDIATSITASDIERRDAAMRLDELKQLLAAPDETREATSARFEAAGRARSTY